MVVFYVYFNGPPMGVARYSANLLSALAPKLVAENVTFRIFCSTDAYRYLQDQEFITHCELERKLDSYVTRVPYFLFVNFHYQKTTIVALTNVSPIFPRKNTRVWSVAHDFTEFFRKHKYGLIRSALRRLLVRSSVWLGGRLICISDKTLSDCRLLLPKASTELIRSGMQPVSKEKCEPVENSGSFILVVGRIDPDEKNLWQVLDHVRRWHQRNSDVRVIFVGGVGDNNKSTKKFLECLDGTEFAEFKGFVSETALRALYKQARFLMFLSLKEGHGLPIYEAFENGCPVVLHRSNDFFPLKGNTPLTYLVSNESDADEYKRICDWFDRASAEDLSQLFCTWDQTADQFLRLLKS